MELPLAYPPAKERKNNNHNNHSHGHEPNSWDIGEKAKTSEDELALKLKLESPELPVIHSSAPKRTQVSSKKVKLAVPKNNTDEQPPNSSGTAENAKVSKDEIAVELELKLSEIIKKMEFLESSNIKLSKQLVDLEDRMNELLVRRSSYAKLSKQMVELEGRVNELLASRPTIVRRQNVIRRVFSSIPAKFPVRIEVNKNILNYVKENPGSPFMFSFIGLLVGAAIKLSTGYGDLANELAVYAYYSLVIGVVAQIVKFAVKRKDVSDSARHPSEETGVASSAKIG